MKILLKIFIASFVLLLSQALTAQETHKGNFNLGFNGGVHFTNINDIRTLNPPGRKTGYTFGPYAEYYISDLFTIKLGLYLDNRGYKTDDLYVGHADSSQLIPDSIVYSDKSYVHFTRDYSVNYLTIPLSFSYVKGSDKFKIFVQAGIYYSILLNAHKKGSDDLYVDTLYAPHFRPPWNIPGHQKNEYNDDASSEFNSFDIGMSLYIGGIIQFNEHWGVTISPGISHSFTHLYSNPEIDARWTQIFKVNAGVVYTFKK